MSAGAGTGPLARAGRPGPGTPRWGCAPGSVRPTACLRSIFDNRIRVGRRGLALRTDLSETLGEVDSQQQGAGHKRQALEVGAELHRTARKDGQAREKVG